MGRFSDQVSQFTVKAQDLPARAVRAISLEMLNRIVLRSPVGNPELWASNAHATAWNRGAGDVNAELRLNPSNLTKAGRLKRGLKVKSKAIGKPTGYVGGRFRGNWQVTMGAQPVAPVDLIDANGSATIARGATALRGYRPDDTIFLTNNVPYAVPLEFGHSSQAPAGMVRITVAEFAGIVNEVARSLQE